MNEELAKELISVTCLASIVPVTCILSVKMRFAKIDIAFENPRRQALIASLFVSVTLILMFLIFSLESQEAPMPLDERRFTLSGIFGQALFFFIISIPAIAYIFIRRQSLQTLGISKGNLKKSFLLGFCISFLWLLTNLFPYNLKLTVNHLLALMHFTLVGFWEEGYFRGFLQMRMCAWLGDVKGWIVSSLLFASIHLPHRLFIERMDMLSSLGSTFFTILPGLVLGYVMLKTRNILAPAMLHTSFNWAGALG